MLEARTCSECGTPLNNDAPEGFCPACMLEGALRIGQNVELLKHPLTRPADTLSPTGGEGRREEDAIHGTQRRFGDYELLDEIARGGMGVVYRARQLRLARIVAVKLILTGHFADKTTVHRFKAEASAAAKLRHPNIVAIHEIGEEAGQHFFSMDYVDGSNLADFIRQQPISIRQTAQLLKTIAEALHYAHEQGIVHRDLKPSNILIDGLLEPRITDFGLAKDLKADSDLTLTGQMLGSPNYISPEQASGKVAVGVATDIYSLGAILYHLLSGRPPFAAETVTSTLQQVANEEPVSPRLLNPSVPRDLETICVKCLEKEPDRRYASAQALAEELDRFLRDEPIHARPVSAPARVWRWCRRKPVVAGLTSAIVVSVMLGFIAVVWQWRKTEQKAQESRRNLYAADMILAQAALEAGNIGRATELLRKYLPRRGEKDLRGWEWRYAWGQCRTDELFTLQGHTLPVSTLALSTNGTILASGSHDGNVILWNLQNKTPLRTLVESNGINGLAFSKEEKELIIGTVDGQASIWNCDSWQRVSTLTNLSPVRSLRISPDGKLLAVFGAPVLTLWNLADRHQLARIKLRRNNEAIAGGLAFSPDSSLLAYSKGDGVIVLRDLAKGEIITELQGHERYVTALAFSPDGSILVSGSRDRSTRVWDVSSQKEVRQFGKYSSFVTSVAFSADGGVLAVVGADQRGRLFETRSWEEINTFKGHSDTVSSVVFSLDGKVILTGSRDSTIKCWAVSTNQGPVSQRLPSDVSAAGLLSDAKCLYLMHTNGTYSVWHPDTFQRIRRIPFPVPDFTISRLSADGNLWAAATTNGLVKIFDHLKERFVAELPCGGTTISKLAFSSDSHMLAAFGNDYTCRVWRLTAPAVPNADAGNLTPKADGDGFQEIGVFETLRQPLWSHLTFSRSGRFLALGYNGGVTEIWNIVTRQKLAPLVGDKWAVTDIAFSQDDSTVITASGSGKVKVWDLRSAREVATLSGQLASLMSVALSPDESRIAACGGDGTVRIWDMETKQEVAALKLHNERLDRVAFRSDDSLVALAADWFGDSRVFVLRAPKLPER